MKCPAKYILINLSVLIGLAGQFSVPAKAQIIERVQSIDPQLAMVDCLASELFHSCVLIEKELNSPVFKLDHPQQKEHHFNPEPVLYIVDSELHYTSDSLLFVEKIPLSPDEVETILMYDNTRHMVKAACTEGRKVVLVVTRAKKTDIQSAQTPLIYSNNRFAYFHRSRELSIDSVNSLLNRYFLDLYTIGNDEFYNDLCEVE